MPEKELIDVNEFCTHHQVEIRFIHSLQEYGLIQLTTIQETGYIPASELQQLEKWTRLYYEMDINMEGIETIRYLLERMNNLQEEINSLKNRLRLYEMNE